MRLELTPGHPRLFITPRELPRWRALANGPRRRWRDELLRRLEPLLASPPALRAGFGHVPEHTALALGQAWRLTGDERYARAGRWLLESIEMAAHERPVGYDTWGVAAEAAALLYDWLHDWWRANGIEEVAARVALYAARRALDTALRVFIVDDWHNYSLGLQAGALAGALAVGRDHPRLEDGTLLRTMHALHFTGLSSEETFLQDAYHVPRTRRCLDATLRAGGGTGFAMHLEALSSYHRVDAWELTKFAEWWTSALTPAARGGKPVWPEAAAAAGEAMLLTERPDGNFLVLGDGNVIGANWHQVDVALHAHARAPKPWFARWIAKHVEHGLQPYPNHLLLRAPIDAAKPSDATLPTSALIDPIALLRSSWREDATLVMFRCGRHAGGHNHLDHNSFTIYRAGALAIDSGGNAYDGDTRPEYSTRTVAHNAILVRDPRERSWPGKYALPVGNDGGQRLVTVSYAPPNDETGAPHAVMTEERRARFADEFDMGQMIAFAPGEAVDYVAGDATRAYTYPWSGIGDNPARRVEEAVRQLVFLKPDLVVVVDRVEATRARFAKTWLLHTVGAPRFRVHGRWRRAETGISELPADGPYEFAQERGRLTVWPLLPGSRRVRAVGGAGYERWIHHDATGAGRNVAGPDQREMGAWRIEVEPTASSLRDVFVTVLHAGLDGEPPARDAVRCSTSRAGGSVRVLIERRVAGAWSVAARLAFRERGPVAAEWSAGDVVGSHRAPAPKRVPRGSPRTRGS